MVSSNDISGTGCHVDNEEAKFSISNSVILLLETGLFLIPIERKKECLFLVLVIVKFKNLTSSGLHTRRQMKNENMCLKLFRPSGGLAHEFWIFQR